MVFYGNVPPLFCDKGGLFTVHDERQMILFGMICLFLFPVFTLSDDFEKNIKS